MSDKTIFQRLASCVAENLEVNEERQTIVTNDDGFIVIQEIPGIEYLTFRQCNDGNDQMINIVGKDNLLILREAVDRMLNKLSKSDFKGALPR